MLTQIKNKVFTLALLIFIAIIFSLSAFIYSNSRIQILQEEQSHFSDRALSLENIINKNVDISLILKNIFEQHNNINISTIQQKYYQQLINQNTNYNTKKNYHVFKLNKKLTTFAINNSIFALGDTKNRDKHYIQQLISILNMQGYQKAVYQNNKSIIASYYMGYKDDRNLLTSIYPPINIDDIMKNVKSLSSFSSHAAIVYNKLAPLAVNPTKKYFWTEPYFDRVGNGMMVSCANPIYHKDKLLGITGVDITLKFLKKFLNKSTKLAENSYIVSPQGYIISGTDINYSNEQELILFSAYLTRLGGKNSFIINQTSLASAPWKFYSLTSKEQLFQQIIADTIYYNVFLLFALITAISSYFYIRKNFIKPAINAEKKLITSNTELNTAKKALELNLIDLQNAQQKIVEAEKLAALGTLVTGMAHELNTPIGVAITANSLIQDKTDNFQHSFNKNKLTKELLSNYLNDIEHSSLLTANNLERIANLVRDFKLISASTESYEQTNFNLKDHISQIINHNKSLALSNNHQVIIKSSDVIIHSYPKIFEQVVSTLLSNSVHHGFKQSNQGTIEITFSEHKDHYQLIYTDNGCGINEVEKPKIFDPFYTSSRGKSKGLGLYTIHNLIKETLHGDIIIADTQNDQGVCFIITWPK